MRDLGDERVVGVGIGEHGADGQQHCGLLVKWIFEGCRGNCTFRDGERRRPLVSEDVETDAAVGVDVGVIDAGGEVNLWGLERVVGRESNAQEEHAGRVRTIGLWRHSGSATVKPDMGRRSGTGTELAQ